MEEGNVQYVDSPVTVSRLCGDSRGDGDAERRGADDRYVVIYMDSSLISWSYSTSEECARKRIISLWVSHASEFRFEREEDRGISARVDDEEDSEGWGE
jgi:hypothetical protein